MENREKENRAADFGRKKAVLIGRDLGKWEEGNPATLDGFVWKLLV